MNSTAFAMPTVRRMTQEQAIKLASFVVTIRPEWSAAPIRGLLQAHTYGTRVRNVPKPKATQLASSSRLPAAIRSLTCR